MLTRSPHSLRLEAARQKGRSESGWGISMVYNNGGGCSRPPILCLGIPSFNDTGGPLVPLFTFWRRNMPHFPGHMSVRTVGARLRAPLPYCPSVYDKGICTNGSTDRKSLN